MNKKFLVLMFFVLLVSAVVGLGLGAKIAKADGVSAHVFGWAWGATNEAPWFGTGWIRFNNCKDDNLDGEPDPGSCVGPNFETQLSDNAFSGYAWTGHEPNNNIGWVSFNRSDTGNPPSDDPGNGSGPIAIIDLDNPSSSCYGRVKGWARALAGDDVALDGWDGWIHLSDGCTLTGGAKHPGGKNYKDGSKGVTYNPAAGSIVGSAWGGPVIGWLKFTNVTAGTPTVTQFDYSLSNSGDIEISQGGSGVVTIDRNLLSGISEPVTLSITSTFPANSGITALPPGNNPCSPTCSSPILFTVASNAPKEDYDVTVKGVSSPSGVTRTTTFELEVERGGVVTIPPGGAGSLSVICSVVSASGQPPYLVNSAVKWQATKQGAATPPYTVNWTFTSPPSSNTSVEELNQPGPNFEIEKVYTKVGPKKVIVSVTDSSDPARTAVTDCTPEINVLLKSDIKEK